MTWLLELLFDSIRTMCAQFIVDAMDSINGVFTDLLSCDLSLFEELFSVAGLLYRNAVLPMGIALLLLICTWQLFKSMFGRSGANAEDPVELVARSLMCLFMVVFAKPMVDYILNFAGTPYGWIISGGITVASFSEFVSAAEIAAGALGIDKISVQLLLLIMQFVVAWNYFKLLFTVTERYVLLGVFSYTSPLAFATGASKTTNNILSNWAKAFGGQVLLIILDAWGLKLYLSAYGNLMASSFGFTRFFVCCLMLIGFCRIMQKLDSNLASIGINIGRTSPGMSGMAIAMMAGRLLGHNSAGETNGSVEHSHAKMSGKEVYPENSSVDAGSGPIPMGSPKAGKRTEERTAAEDSMERRWHGNGDGYSRDDVQRSHPETGKERGNSRKMRMDGAAWSNSGGRKEPDASNTAADAGRDYGQNIPGKGKQGVKGPVVDGGTVAGYDEETWRSRQEEAAFMEAAMDTVSNKDRQESNGTGNGDVGIISSPVPPGEEVLMEPEGYSSGMKAEHGDVNGKMVPDASDVTETVEKTAVPGGNAGTAEKATIPGSNTEPAEKVALSGANAGTGGSARGMRKLAGTSRVSAGGSGAGSVSADMEGIKDRPKDTGKGGNHSRRREKFSQSGKLYLSADVYEEPDIPYQMAHKDGHMYYAVSQKAADGGVKAQLQEDGSIRYDIAGTDGWKPQRKAGMSAAIEKEHKKHDGQDGG